MHCDYLIVGAGSAGAVLASRLSEDPSVQVLLLEAGDADGGFWEALPLGVAQVLADASRLWCDDTVPSESTAGRSVQWISGLGIGGSSAVNGMLFVRGHPARYDAMAAAGCDGWSYEDCLPFFRRLEDCRFSDSNARAVGGPIGVTRLEPDPLAEAFLTTLASAGFQRVDDYNDSLPDGASYLQLSSRRGMRVSTATGYLTKARLRPNLRILTGARVDKVLLERGIARGVTYRRRGQSRQAHARLEVLVCAGAIRSPRLLELSGIGDPELLVRHGIPVAVASPEVGNALQDHLMARLCFETSATGTVNHMLRSKTHLLGELARFAITRRGLLATTSLKATAFVRSEPQLPVPDLRIQLSLMSASTRVPEPGPRTLLPRFSDGLDPESSFHIGVYGLYPESRGSTHIRSSNPDDAPQITPNYLQQETDRRILLAGLRLVRRLTRSPPLATLIRRELRAPGDDDEALLEFASRTGHTCWHPIGTCRMGSDARSVVDPACRVRGAQRLRVIDASVFPFQVSSNTNVPVIMLAEKMATTLRSDALHAIEGC